MLIPPEAFLDVIPLMALEFIFESVLLLLLIILGYDTWVTLQKVKLILVELLLISLFSQALVNLLPHFVVLLS